MFVNRKYDFWTPIRTVADQHQSQNQLVQSALGHGQMKQNLVVTLRWCKRFIERTLCFVTLLIDKLSAYLMGRG